MTTGLLVAAAVVVLNLFWAVSVLVGLPGSWLMIATAVAADHWWSDEAMFSAKALWIAAGIAALGEVAEFSMSSLGASRAGASRTGALGAFAGGVLGAIAGTLLLPFPVLGTLAGALVGAFLGSSLLEYGRGNTAAFSMRVGRAAATGQVLGTLAKFGLSVVVFVVLAVSAFLA